MQSYVLAILATLFLAGCDRLPPWPQRGTYRGEYSVGFEASRFKPCGINEEWWVENAGALADAAIPPNANPTRYQSYRIYAEVRARVSRRGRFGHLGFYDREMKVLKVIGTTSTPYRECRQN